MSLSIIVAVSDNNVIGHDNGLPWKISSDLKRFKELTIDHPIIMGRKTYDSIGRILPKRENIIITRNQNFTVKGCTVLHSLEEAVKHVGSKDAFVIGGGNIYIQSMDFVDILYVTEVHTTLEGDAFFPEIDSNIWKEVEREDYMKDEHNQYDYSFVKYVRKVKKTYLD